jgi:hypothetical protein
MSQIQIIKQVANLQFLNGLFATVLFQNSNCPLFGCWWASGVWVKLNVVQKLWLCVSLAQLLIL